MAQTDGAADYRNEFQRDLALAKTEDDFAGLKQKYQHYDRDYEQVPRVALQILFITVTLAALIWVAMLAFAKFSAVVLIGGIAASFLVALAITKSNNYPSTNSVVDYWKWADAQQDHSEISLKKEAIRQTLHKLQEKEASPSSDAQPSGRLNADRL